MKKKIMTISLVVALAAIAIVGGTLAYFTDKTETKTNTFAVGNVKIYLDEPRWDESETHTLMPGVTYDKNPTITVDENSQDCYVFLDMHFNKYSSLFWVMAADASADENIDFTIFDENGALLDKYKNAKGVFSTTKFVEEMKNNKGVFQQIVNKWFGGIVHKDWKTFGVDLGTINDKCITIRLGYQKDGGVVKANYKIQFMSSFGMPASVTAEMIAAGVNVGKMQNPFNSTDTEFKMNFTAYAIQASEIKTLDAAYEALFPTPTNP